MFETFRREVSPNVVWGREKFERKYLHGFLKMHGKVGKVGEEKRNSELDTTEARNCGIR